MKEKFYISCQPGLEQDLIQEILEVQPWLIGKDGRPASGAIEFLETDLGGVLVECDRLSGFQLNRHLKTASRILLRLKSFKAFEFPSLVHQLKKISFKEHLEATVKFRSYKVSCSKSKLNNEKRVLQVLEEVFGATSDSSDQDLYVRIFSDEVFVSLDTSGEHLHFRGWRTQAGEAPIRETLAAWAAKKMIGQCTRNQLSKVCLLDPTAGSGTMLIEAERIYQQEGLRKFAYQSFVSCPQTLKDGTLSSTQNRLFAGLFAIDIAAQMQEVLLGNQSRAGVKLEFLAGDFQKVDYQGWLRSVGCTKDKSVWIIANPPYNIRLNLDLPQASMAQIFADRFSAERIGLFSTVPQKMSSKGDYTIESEWQLSNGGIKVYFTVVVKK